LTDISDLLDAMPDTEAIDRFWQQICREMVAQTAASEYERGRADGHLATIAKLKRAQHQAVDDLDAYLDRWHACCRQCRLGGYREGCTDCQTQERSTFGEAVAGDRTPAEALAAARASWEPLGLDPGPGWVHLGGSVVHHHQCKPACYQHEPGWYRIEDAIAIIETLPGNYAENLAQLRAQAAATTGRTAA
jgi:hypothetical protein